jgi:hypothetical protein
MKGSTVRQKKWASNRKEVYEGSIMHFMRSLYLNTITKEGFEVRSLHKQPNLEKERVKQIFRTSVGNSDSSHYYERILKQPNQFSIVGKNILPRDSFAYVIDSTTSGLAFDNFLLILYKKRAAPAEYRKQFPGSSASMLSEITLFNSQPVEIQSNGNYYQPLDLLSLGYWSWSEKIATMLPLDYMPNKK